MTFLLGNQTLNRNIKSQAVKRKKQMVRNEKKVAKLINGFDNVSLDASSAAHDKSDLNDDNILE